MPCGGSQRLELFSYMGFSRQDAIAAGVHVSGDVPNKFEEAMIALCTPEVVRRAEEIAEELGRATRMSYEKLHLRRYG